MIERFFASVRFMLGMFVFFGGAPFLLYALLLRFFFHHPKLLFPTMICYYHFVYKTFPDLGFDSNFARALCNNLFHPLYKLNGGKVIRASQPLDSDKSYMFVCIPHGVVAYFWGLPLGETGLSKYPIMLAARFLFRFPIVRELYGLSAVEGTPLNVAKIFHHKRSCAVRVL